MGVEVVLVMEVEGEVEAVDAEGVLIENARCAEMVGKGKVEPEPEVIV